MNRTVDIPLSSLNDSDSELDEQPSIPKPEEPPIDPVSSLKESKGKERFLIGRLNCNGLLGCGFMSNNQRKKHTKFAMLPERN